jgi:hypothetical protein
MDLVLRAAIVLLTLGGAIVFATALGLFAFIPRPATPHVHPANRAPEHERAVDVFLDPVVAAGPPCLLAGDVLLAAVGISRLVRPRREIVNDASGKVRQRSKVQLRAGLGMLAAGGAIFWIEALVLNLFFAGSTATIASQPPSRLTAIVFGGAGAIMISLALVVVGEALVLITGAERLVRAVVRKTGA